MITDDYRIITAPEKDIRDLKALAKNGPHLLELVYLILYDVDLSNPELEEGSIKPENYRISEKLSSELINFSIETFKEDPVAINMLWLNWSPSIKQELSRNEIAINVKEAWQNEKRKS